MFKTVKDPAKWMKYHLRYVSAAARRTVRQATTEAEKWRVLRVALAADPLNYPAEYARPTADRTARRLTGCDGYAALVAALLAGERPAIAPPANAGGRRQLAALRRHLGALALEV